VVGSPNHQERIGSIERRIAALEPSAKGSVNALQRKLDRLKRTLRRMEGHKTIEERVEELSKRVIDLERRPVRPPRACGQADWMIPPLSRRAADLLCPPFAAVQGHGYVFGQHRGISLRRVPRETPGNG
jgi:hypothetical protein